MSLDPVKFVNALQKMGYSYYEAIELYRKHVAQYVNTLRRKVA